jgi:hypothetical protein
MKGSPTADRHHRRHAQAAAADVKFKNLGLVIVDEEQRFGVRHKEQLKALRAEVDVLTLTATPIPRTLGMALEGLRDLSLIATRRSASLASRPSFRSERIRHDPRGAAARAEARRPGVLPAQRGRDIENRLEKLKN